ncbi:MAG: hypothetical protein LBT24_06060 [Tannerella sp.]|jgi:hypothetical protein|nr:hypothetical protein [Tannerella sp.]
MKNVFLSIGILVLCSFGHVRAQPLPAFPGAEGWGMYAKDGIPDKWETVNGLNPNDASDANKTDNQGYTYIEKYINSLILYSLSVH